MAWVGIGSAVVLVVAVLAAAVLLPVYLSHRTVSTSDCQEAVPAGASLAATEFLTDLNSGYVGWTRVSRSIHAEHDVVHLNDLMNEQAIDSNFTELVATIKFTGPAAATANAYLRVLHEYTRALNRAIDQSGYYAANHERFMELDNARFALAQRLRGELDLPPAVCSLERP
jgi:hypothetical protein